MSRIPNVNKFISLKDYKAPLGAISIEVVLSDYLASGALPRVKIYYDRIKKKAELQFSKGGTTNLPELNIWLRALSCLYKFLDILNSNSRIVEGSEDTYIVSLEHSNISYREFLKGNIC